MATITVKELEAMTEEQWQEYRRKSWEAKREYYNRPIPDWYLADKKGFADFLERKQNFKKR